MEASNFDTAGTPEADYGAKMITAFAGGAAPDVIWTTTRRIIPFASAGGLIDLTPLYSRSKISNDQYYPQAIEEQTLDGKLFGITQGWGVGVLGINRTLFENAGVTLRPDFDKTWTHAEFHGHAQAGGQAGRAGQSGDLGRGLQRDLAPVVGLRRRVPGQREEEGRHQPDRRAGPRPSSSGTT